MASSGCALPGVQAVAILFAVLLTQAVCSQLWQLPRYDPRSALIPGLALCLLLQGEELHEDLKASQLLGGVLLTA